MAFATDLAKNLSEIYLAHFGIKKSCGNYG